MQPLAVVRQYASKFYRCNTSVVSNLCNIVYFYNCERKMANLQETLQITYELLMNTQFEGWVLDTCVWFFSFSIIF